MGQGGGRIGLDGGEAEGSREAAAANWSRGQNGRWRRERGGLTQRRGVADRLPGGGRFFDLELCDRCIRFPVRALIGTAVGTTGQLDGGTARDRPPWDSGRSNAAQAPPASYWARFAPMDGGLGRTDAMDTCLRCCLVTCAPPREPQNRSIARRSRRRPWAGVAACGWPWTQLVLCACWRGVAS